MITPESIFKIRAVLKAIQELTPDEQVYMMDIMSAFKAGGKPAAIGATIDGYQAESQPDSGIGQAAGMKTAWDSFTNGSEKPVRCNPNDR